MNESTMSLFEQDASFPVVAKMICATTLKGGVSRNGKLPWIDSHRGDLPYFRKKTYGHPVIMGRKTYESIGHPLEGRDNIVVSKDNAHQCSDAICAPSLSDAFKYGVEKAKYSNLYIIGGRSIWEQCFKAEIVDILIKTVFLETHDADQFFPADAQTDMSWETDHISEYPDRTDAQSYRVFLRGQPEFSHDRKGWKQRIESIRQMEEEMYD